MSIETDNLEMENTELKATNLIMRDNIDEKDKIIKKQEDEMLLLHDTLRKVHDILDVAKKMIDLGLRR